MRKLVPIAAAAIISVARIAGAAPPTVARHTCISTKFQKHLVESGACSAVNFNYVTQVNAGDIAIMFEANPDRIETCVKAVFNELPLMKKLIEHVKAVSAADIQAYANGRIKNLQFEVVRLKKVDAKLFGSL